MAEGRRSRPSGGAAGKRHPLSRREAGRINRPPAGGDEALAKASWPLGAHPGGRRFMVTPTLGCSIQADVKLKILYGKLSKYLLAGSGSPRRASIVRCSGEKTMSIIRI